MDPIKKKELEFKERIDNMILLRAAIMASVSDTCINENRAIDDLLKKMSEEDIVTATISAVELRLAKKRVT